MKFNISKSIVLVYSLLLILQSCQKEEGSGGSNISSFNAKNSHNMGKNCMACHTQGGEGNGVFNVAGTVYNSTKTATFPNPVIKLYTAPNGGGSLKYTINGDALGNFFTTDTIDFGNGLYPSVEGNTSTNFMSTALTTGQCNSCHNVSTDKIWIN